MHNAPEHFLTTRIRSPAVLWRSTHMLRSTITVCLILTETIALNITRLFWNLFKESLQGMWSSRKNYTFIQIINNCFRKKSQQHNTFSLCHKSCGLDMTQEMRPCSRHFHRLSYVISPTNTPVSKWKIYTRMHLIKHLCGVGGGIVQNCTSHRFPSRC